MRRWKRNLVDARPVFPVTQRDGAVVEALESRTLLSRPATAAVLPPIDLSGAFAKFNSSAMAGKKYSETISVSNHGAAAVTGTLPILVYTSPDGTIGSGTALPVIDKKIKIKAGKTAKIALSLKAPAEASQFHLVVQLDPNSTLGEDLASNTFSSSSTVTVKTPPFKRGSIVGQNGWIIDSSGGSSTAVVSTNIAPPTHGNKQTIVITRAAGSDIGVAPPATITSAAPFTVTAQVQVNFRTTANGPFFGLNLFGNSGAVNIASFGVDSANGNVYDFANGSGAFLLSDGSPGAPAPLATGTWNTFKVVADFTSGAGGPVSLSYFLNNTLVDTETITAGVVLSANFAYLWSEQAFGAADGAPDAAGSAAFDNYSLTTTAVSTVPQPKGLTFP